MIILGLTGSIGMGKSTTAEMFRMRGVPVYDADAAVHQLYREALVPQIEAAFPGTTSSEGVDRVKLSQAVLTDPAAMQRLERIVHPAVRATQQQFLKHAQEQSAPLVVLDIPLLFEARRQGDVDKIAVVTCPAELQRARVLARPGMTEDRLEAILARQMPDAAKRLRADYVIDTGTSLDATAAEVDALIERLLSQASSHA